MNANDNAGCGCLIILVVIAIVIWIFSGTSCNKQQPATVQPVSQSSTSAPLSTKPLPPPTPSLVGQPAVEQTDAPKDSLEKPETEEPSQEHARLWTDDAGKFHVEATFVEMTLGKVKLRKKDGGIISVPMERLGDEDQKWVRNWLASISHENSRKEEPNASTDSVHKTFGKWFGDSIRGSSAKDVSPANLSSSSLNNPKTNNRKVLGSWFDDDLPGFENQVTIFSRGKQLYMENKYQDGGGVHEEEIVIKRLDDNVRYQRKRGGGHSGEYYLIDSQGDLQLWDKDGFISTAKKL